MRIRSIRPEFWASEDIAALTWAHRLIYIGLWSYVDDNGVGRDNERLILADLFPLDKDAHGALKQIAGALTEYSNRQMVTRYSVDNRRFLHITAWDRHQKINRPSEGRYPLPTCGDAVIHGGLSELSLSPQVKAPLGEGEKGRRGEGEEPSSATLRVADDERPDVDDLCQHLADQIEANGSKRPTVTKRWRTSARLLLDVDGRTPDQVRAAIDWCQADEFWRSNILSMPKLREKYDQLRLAATRNRPGRDRVSDILRGEYAWAEQVEAASARPAIGGTP